MSGGIKIEKNPGGEFTMGVVGECSVLWIDLEELVVVWENSDTHQKRSKTRQKVWNSIRDLFSAEAKRANSPLRLVDFVDRKHYRNQILDDIVCVLSSSTNSTADEVRLADSAKECGEEACLISISAMGRLLRARIVGSRSRYEDAKARAGGVIVRVMEMLKPRTPLKYSLVTGDRSLKAFERIQASVKKHGGATWVDSANPFKDGMSAESGWVFMLSEDGLDWQNEILSKVIEKQVIGQWMTDRLPAPDPSLWVASSSTVYPFGIRDRILPKAGRPIISLRERLDRAEDAATTAVDLSRSRSFNVYCALNTLLYTAARTGQVACPVGLSADGMVASKIPFSCVRVRSFFDIDAPPQSRSAQGVRRQNLTLTTLSIPPLRLDAIGMDKMYAEFRRVYSARVQGGEWKSHAASLKEMRVFESIQRLISVTPLGTDRTLMVTCDLGSAQRKFWYFCMLSRSPHNLFPRCVMEGDPPHRHSRICVGIRTSIIAKVTRMVKKLNGTKYSFSHSLSKYASVLNQLKKEHMEKKQVPVAVQMFSDLIEAEGRLVYGHHWTTYQVMDASFARALSQVSTNHARWCEDYYATIWLSTRWYMLLAVSEMIVANERRSAVNLNNPQHRILNRGDAYVSTAKGAAVKFRKLKVVDVERAEEEVDWESVSSDTTVGTEDHYDRDSGGEDVEAERGSQGQSQQSPPPVQKSKLKTGTAAKYSYNVPEQVVKILRDRRARVETICFAHVSKAPLLLHSLHIMESHRILQGDHQRVATLSITPHTEIFYSLAMALSVKTATDVDDPVLAWEVAQFQCCEEVMETLGGFLLKLLRLQCNAMLERNIGIYRCLNYGKDQPGMGPEELDARRKWDSEFRDEYDRMFAGANRGSQSSNKFAMGHTADMLENVMGETFQQIDLFDYRFNTENMQAEIAVYDKMQKVSNSSEKHHCPKCHVFEVALKGFHHCWVYTQFIQMVKKSLESATETNDAAEEDLEKKAQWDHACAFVEELRAVRQYTTRSIEADGRKLSMRSQNNVGATTGCPWRLLSTAVPVETFPFLASSKTEEDIRSRNVDYVRTRCESFEDFAAPCGLTPPSILIEALANMKEHNGNDVLQGQSALDSLAAEVGTIREGKSTSTGTTDWWRKKEEFDRICSGAGVSDPSDEFVRSYLKWGIDAQRICDAGLAEMFIHRHFDILLDEAEDMSRLQLGNLACVILDKILTSKDLVVLRSKALGTPFLLLGAYPLVNAIVTLDLRLDNRNVGGGLIDLASSLPNVTSTSTKAAKVTFSADHGERDSSQSRTPAIELYRFPQGPRAYVFNHMGNKHPGESCVSAQFLLNSSITEWDYDVADARFARNQGELVIGVPSAESSTGGCPILMLLRLMVTSRKDVVLTISQQKELAIALAKSMGFQVAYDLLTEIPQSRTLQEQKEKMEKKGKKRRGGKELQADEAIGAHQTAKGGNNNNMNGNNMTYFSLDGDHEGPGKSLLPSNAADSAKRGNSASASETRMESDVFARARQEFSEGDIAAISILTATSFHRLLCLWYFKSHDETINFLINLHTGFVDRLLYWLELSPARDSLLNPLYERLKKKRGRDGLKDRDAVEETKRQKKEDAKAKVKAHQEVISKSVEINLGSACKVALGIPMDLRERRQVRTMETSKASVPSIDGDAKNKEKQIAELERQWGMGATAEDVLELEQMRLSWHTPEANLLLMQQDETQRRYDLKCPFCLSDQVLGWYHRVYIRRGKGPTAEYFGKDGFKSSRALGPGSHYVQNDKQGTCYCGKWTTEGRLICESVDNWWGCSVLHAVVDLVERGKTVEQRTCTCVYPSLQAYVKCKTNWVNRRPMKDVIVEKKPGKK